MRGDRRGRYAGMAVPAGCVVGSREAPRAAAGIGFPVAVKMVSERLPHKTEAGAVALGISSPAEVEAAVARIHADVRRHDAGALSDHFLIELQRSRHPSPARATASRTDSPSARSTGSSRSS